MFDATEIRPLARSEEMFAQTHNFVGLGAHLSGPVDVDALADAFDALLEARPVLGARIEPVGDGWRLVADDLLHEGIVVDPPGSELRIRFDQSQALVHLRVVPDGEATAATLYVHHALADGHHQFALIEELFALYTALVTTGTVDPGPAKPAPEPLETVLAERGVGKGRRSGLERFVPAMFAYDLPPSRRAVTGDEPDRPVLVPMAQHTLTEAETDSLVALSREHRVSLNGILSAAVLVAEWRLRGEARIPVPYLYPVDLRYVLTPAVSATGCTNPVGVATYLAEIDSGTDVLALGREIAEAFRADLSEGVLAQSLLHFTPQYAGNPPGLPDVVMLTDNGAIPPVPMPPGVELTAVHGELYFQVGSGIDMYTSKLFRGRLQIEYHTHAPDPEFRVKAIRGVLEELAGPR
ncbi:acyltransferase [Tsukamurella sp. 8F]|uniref:phthiocerol/phthiodiolone dimycocerosyl transferase family protein n=1 Tax=unclassified Tsukamurella TaxID=2633480 RepID=UPI0023BA2C94|nr:MULTISPECIES: acyltransferase [unclassified Tsukamurella]MDF0530500.1 acyltransferase [Tsukamurella sp. 8J]MDF0586850.1 acyltransferase [Tsukamurella sp. 8F]